MIRGRRAPGCKVVFIFPNEPDSVPLVLFIWSHFAIGVSFSLLNDPNRKSLVVFVVVWRDAIARFV